jgi:hypothetical protein
LKGTPDTGLGAYPQPCPQMTVSLRFTLPTIPRFAGPARLGACGADPHGVPVSSAAWRTHTHTSGSAKDIGEMMAQPGPHGPLPQSEPDRGDFGFFQPDAPARIGQSQPENTLFRVSGWLMEPLTHTLLYLSFGSSVRDGSGTRSLLLTRTHTRTHTHAPQVRPDWELVEQIPLASLSKCSMAHVPEGADVVRCGQLEYYDKVGFDTSALASRGRTFKIAAISAPLASHDRPRSLDRGAAGLASQDRHHANNVLHH